MVAERNEEKPIQRWLIELVIFMCGDKREKERERSFLPHNGQGQKSEDRFVLNEKQLIVLMSSNREQRMVIRE